MSKSTGNYIRMIDLIAEGYSPLAYRLLLLQVHYRSTMNFKVEALAGAQEALYGIYRSISKLPEHGAIDQEFLKKFGGAINDDLNTPIAVAFLFELLKSNIDGASKRATALKFDEVLGLEIKEGAELISTESEETPKNVKELLQKREESRKNKNFEEADQLRA